MISVEFRNRIFITSVSSEQYEWLIENINLYWSIGNIGWNRAYYYDSSHSELQFKRKTDLMAFKLRWMQGIKNGEVWNDS